MCHTYNTYRQALSGARKLLWMLVVLIASASSLMAKEYRCELGLQGGAGYYVGDATEHVFQNVREAYGAQFRYKFDPRWSLQVKGMAHRITGTMDDLRTTTVEGDGSKWTNQMVNLDVMAEYNFLRIGISEYDYRVKPYSPFIALGLGASLHGEYKVVSAYIPVAVGFKWKFAEHWGLNIAWQHNIYLADNVENIEHLDNTHKMNGTNIMNVDVTSQLTFGIVFEFAEKGRVCRMCLY